MGLNDPSKFALTSPALKMTALAAAMANENSSFPQFQKRRIAKKANLPAKNGGWPLNQSS